MRPLILLTVLAGLAACAPQPADPPANSAETLATLFSADSLSAEAVIERAHAAAGGEEWLRPESLTMEGYGVFYRDGVATRHERHRMWRVYADEKQDARRADGKVRILSERDGVPVIDVAFDGTTTYTPAGPQAASAADARWASNFGFGVIRHARDAGYTLDRLPDDLIDARPAYMVRVTDPAGGRTQFGIAQDDYAVLKVSFDTERGWHERIYSHFFSNPGDNWVQPGRVRLYYDGVKANEVIWEGYTINAALPDCLFVLPSTPDCG